VDYRRFEREFLRIAFTTSADLTPASMAFAVGIGIGEAERHMQRLVSHGVLELASDDDGHMRFTMPDRPAKPLTIAEHAALMGAPPPYPDAPMIVPPRAIVVHDPNRTSVVSLRREMPPITPSQAMASMFLNAMVCPGVGSLVGGKTRAGMAQLSLFLIGLPLIFVAVGLPMVLAAWTSGAAGYAITRHECASAPASLPTFSCHRRSSISWARSAC
jgi:hypothetical protein